jgi:hypothetical protein
MVGRYWSRLHVLVPEYAVNFYSADKVHREYHVLEHFRPIANGIPRTFATQAFYLKLRPSLYFSCCSFSVIFAVISCETEQWLLCLAMSVL